MQPPIPEVPKVSPPSKAKPAFFGLKVAVSVNYGLTVAAFLLELVFSKEGVLLFYSWPFLVIEMSVLALYGFYNFLLWRGYNWVRWIAIAFSAACLITALMQVRSGVPSSKYVLIAYIVETARFFWTVGLGLWLLLPNVARHFKTPKPI